MPALGKLSLELERNDLEIQITPHSFDCFDHTRRLCPAVHLLLDLDAFHKWPECILDWHRVSAFWNRNMGECRMDRFPGRADEFCDLSHSAVAALLSSRVPGCHELVDTRLSSCQLFRMAPIQDADSPVAGLLLSEQKLRSSLDTKRLR